MLMSVCLNCVLHLLFDCLYQINPESEEQYSLHFLGIMEESICTYL